MGWGEHHRPNLKRQEEIKEEIQTTLAEFQYTNGFSREEMADHFRKQAEKISQGEVIVVQNPIDGSFNSFDQVAKNLRQKKIIYSANERKD